MPAKESIRSVVNLISPQNVRYKILRTTETDGYESDAKSSKKRGSKPQDGRR